YEMVLVRRGTRVRSGTWPWCYIRRSSRCWSRGRGRRLLVKVSRTLPGVAADGGVRRADKRSDAIPRQCGAEIVIQGSVAGNERVGLAPVAARFGEQIGLALIGVVSHRGGVRAYEGGAALEGNRIAEVSVRRTVVCSQLLSLAPIAVRFSKDVGRALPGMAVDSRIVRADESGATLEGDRLTEAVVRRAVAGGELLRLAPRAIRLGENIDCPLGGVGAYGSARRTD